MIKPDVIAVNPTHIDFPMFRYQIRQYRNLYNKVIIVFSEHYTGQNLQQSIQQAMQQDQITFLNPCNPTGRDWRDAAVHNALQYSDASHVLFLEQDFIINSSHLLEEAFKQSSTVGFKETDLPRLHPAFLFMSRDNLNKTSCNFAANPPHWDHFGQIEVDLKLLNCPIAELEEMNFTSPDDWEHLAGLVHNYTLLINNQPVTYHLERFQEYNKEVLSLDIETVQEFINIINKATI